MSGSLDWLLRLFGVSIDGALRVVRLALQWRNGGAFPFVAVLSVAGGLLAWWSYRNCAEFVSHPRRRILVALRSALFVLVLLILLRPVLTITVEGSVRRMLPVLFDTSASMGIQDARLNAAELARARRFCAPEQAPHVARIDLVKGLLADSKLRLVPELKKTLDVDGFGFGTGLSRLDAGSREAPTEQAWAKSLEARQPATAMGDAIVETLRKQHGGPLAGIFLVTDGGNNAGSSPVEAARLAKEQRVPLYIYGVGVTAQKDVIVKDLSVPELAFSNDLVHTTVRVSGQGYAGEKGRLVLKLGEEIVAEKEITFTAENEQSVPMEFTPKKAGDFQLQVSIAPLQDEAVSDNNSTSKRLRIADNKIRVLSIEQTPRWEFRYVQNVLLRDHRVTLKCVLIEGDPALAQAENSPYLEKIPEKTELFGYDLVILGDVDPKAFKPGQMEAIGEFVSRFGGSLISMAGKSSNPKGYRATVLEKLLPVELGTQDDAEKTTEPIRGALTPLGRGNPMLRLAATEDENATRWNALPPLQWAVQGVRGKPGAQVLVEDANPAHATRSGRLPLIALQQYGMGQVLYMGSDNTWRWRKNAGEGDFAMLWGSMVQRMALMHLLGGARRTQLTVDRLNYITGETVTVFARLYDEKFEPVRREIINGSYAVEPKAGGKDTVVMRAVPGQSGSYRGEFVAATPGHYRFMLATGEPAAVVFDAADPRAELSQTSMNEAGLREMAETSGGAFFREEDLERLPTLLAKTDERVRSEQDAELWATPIYFALMLIIAAAEWLLRKKWGLK